MKATFLHLGSYPGPFYEDGRRTYQLFFKKRMFFGLLPAFEFYQIRCLTIAERQQFKPGNRYTI